MSYAALRAMPNSSAIARATSLLRLGLARAVDHQHDLALDARALPLARGERVAHLGQRAPHHFLVQLRQLAAHGDLAVRNRFRQRGQGRHQAVRALVEQQRRIERAQALHHGATFGVLAREEAAEIEARVRAAAGHVRRGHGRGARQHLHRHARLAGGAHEAQPRIGHARHAGVRAVRDHFACRHALNQRRRALADERLVQPLDALLDAECR